MSAEDEQWQAAAYENNEVDKEMVQDITDLSFDEDMRIQEERHESGSEEEEEEEEKGPARGAAPGRDEYSETVQALSYDRTFSKSGKQMHVYQTDPVSQESLKRCAKLPPIKLADGETLDATEFMLHDNEKRMLFLDSMYPNSVFSYDFEKSVVDEFGASKGSELCMLASDYKNSQAEAVTTFLAGGPRDLMRMDPRENNRVKAVEKK